MLGEFSLFRQWFIDHWMRAGLVVAGVMLLTLPVYWSNSNRTVMLTTILLPLYMIHQYEEHAQGKFVAVFNATIGKGYQVLTEVSAFMINFFGVWVVYLVAFYLARYVNLGFALIVSYLMLVNALAHIASAAVMRLYNPGLWTAVALFLPSSI